MAVLLITAATMGALTIHPGAIGDPIDDAQKRPQLLTFGLHVTPDPEHNPIDPPERFAGFHSALDYEVFADEADEEVIVRAACPGDVVYAGTAEGYGGVIVHRCVVHDEDVTVLYGHIDPVSFTVDAGDTVDAGQRIAVLAPARTYQSGYNRKHLHFGVHRGRDVALTGYVQSEAALENFIDPQTLVPRW